MISLNGKGHVASLERLRWLGYLAKRRLGAPGLIMAAVLMALVVANVFFIQSHASHLEAVRDESEKRLQGMPEPRMHQGKPNLTLREVQRLQSGAQAYSIFQILKSHGLAGKQATYSRQIEAKGKLRRLTIDMAMTGSYSALRAAIREIADQPAARIDRLSVERESIESPVVNVDMKITLLGPDS